MLSPPGNAVIIYSVAGITEKSFSKIFTKHNTERGFNMTGIYLLNKNVFHKDELL
jgi:hypothetical protein